MPARLVIVGDGPERAALQALAAAEGVGAQVEFAGHRVDPAPFYAGFDIFALSSDTEQMPLSVLEAMATGLCVVSTAVGGIPFLLDDGDTALLVPPNDPDAMTAAVERILDDAALANRLSSRARTFAASRDWAQILPPSILDAVRVNGRNGPREDSRALAWLLVAMAMFTAGLLRQFHDLTPASPF
jgi:glycosyltransferase involved in cell wall biosynthesis